MGKSSLPSSLKARNILRLFSSLNMKSSVLTPRFLYKKPVSWRRDKKEPYPPDTLYCLCCSLFRALKENDCADIKPFEDPTFAAFNSRLDARMKALKSTGEYQIHRAEVISKDLEDILWQKGLLGESTPLQLLDTLVFYIGLYFALRSGQEHCAFATIQHRSNWCNRLMEMLTWCIRKTSRKLIRVVSSAVRKHQKKWLGPLVQTIKF